jgi:K+-transporting ATPase ATPase A chain
MRNQESLYPAFTRSAVFRLADLRATAQLAGITARTGILTLHGWLQIALVLALVLGAAWPMGRFIAAVLAGRRIFLHPLLGPIERGLYWLAGVDPAQEMGWRDYAIAMLWLNALHFALLYAMLRLQFHLPLNPQHASGLSAQVAFNTAMSFVTGTNWQAYTGETALSDFSQMVGLTSHMFVSAASAAAVAAVLMRALARGGVSTFGNFWADTTRVLLYLLLPLAMLVGCGLLTLGVPLTLGSYIDAHTLEGGRQTLAIGPVALMEAIKNLGTNGGGFFNANAAHPFEDPNVWSNYLEMWAVIVIPIAFLFAFGRIVQDRAHARSLLWVTMLFVIVAVGVCYYVEAQGNPLLTAIGIDPAQGNMEGKEVRFGPAMSALYTVVVTATSGGSANAAYDSFLPLGSLVPMVLMQLGEMLPGGVGAGLAGLVVFVLLTVFIAGLMVGRTPEYLGKKIQAREMKLAMLSILVLPLCALGGAAVSLVLPAALASLGSAGPHGLTEMLYAYTSSTTGNGSIMAGLNADTPWLDTTLGIAMLLGRYATLVPVLAIAGSLGPKAKAPEGVGTFPTRGLLFGALLGGQSYT